MARVMIRYRVRPDQVRANVELLRAFFDELASSHPDGLRYETFQLDDKVSFVHFVETESGPGAFAGLRTFQRYRATVESRCEEPPVMSQLTEIASFDSR